MIAEPETEIVLETAILPISSLLPEILQLDSPSFPRCYLKYVHHLIPDPYFLTISYTFIILFDKKSLLNTTNLSFAVRTHDVSQFLLFLCTDRSASFT
jgi:hypothetical protein